MRRHRAAFVWYAAMTQIRRRPGQATKRAKAKHQSYVSFSPFFPTVHSSFLSHFSHPTRLFQSPYSCPLLHFYPLSAQLKRSQKILCDTTIPTVNLTVHTVSALHVCLPTHYWLTPLCPYCNAEVQQLMAARPLTLINTHSQLNTTMPWCVR